MLISLRLQTHLDLEHCILQLVLGFSKCLSALQICYFHWNLETWKVPIVEILSAMLFECVLSILSFWAVDESVLISNQVSHWLHLQSGWKINLCVLF